MILEIQVGDIIRFEDTWYKGVGIAVRAGKDSGGEQYWEVNLSDDEGDYCVYPEEVKEVWHIGVVEKEN